MNNKFTKLLFCAIIILLLFSSCRKDTSPIDAEQPPERPTTGNAILTGYMYYGSPGNRPAKNSKIIVFFFNDYSDTLAVADIDAAGNYYIEHLPEDTVDLIVAQPFYDNILISSKISDIPLNAGINEASAEQIYTQNWVDHFTLVSDHFMVIFDTASQQTVIDSFNTYHNILSVKFYTSFINRDYYFLEIDPTRDVLSLIDVYHQSELTLEAGPLFYDPFREIYYWSLGSINTAIKDWVSLDQIETVASDLNLDLNIRNARYLFRMTKNTPLIQEKLRMKFYFCPLFQFANVVYDQTLEYSPAPWE